MTPKPVRTVAVDFDGVLHSYERGWHDGTIYGDWKPDAVAAMTRLMGEYAVFVHTTRSPRQVARWIERNSGYALECTTRCAPWRTFWDVYGVLLVTRRKLPAVAYLDDRALPFTDWRQALKALGVELPWKDPDS